MILTYNDIEYNVSDKYSFKDFTSVAYIHDDLSGLVVYGSCFSKEDPDYPFFKGKVAGLTLIKCNLDNILIPDGVTTIDCWQRRFKVQNDLRDWYIDDQNAPTEVVHKSFWEKHGVKTSKLDIPEQKISVPVDKDFVTYLKENL